MKRSTIRNKLDKIVSEIVRSRGECVWCGNKNYELLQACHIYGRANLAVRWDIASPNVICMCAGCHFKAHNRPTEFTDFIREYLGETRYLELRNKANVLKTWANYELQEMYDQLKKFQSDWSGT